MMESATWPTIHFLNRAPKFFRYFRHHLSLKLVLETWRHRALPIVAPRLVTRIFLLDWKEQVTHSERGPCFIFGFA